FGASPRHLAALARPPIRPRRRDARHDRTASERASTPAPVLQETAGPTRFMHRLARRTGEKCLRHRPSRTSYPQKPAKIAGLLQVEYCIRLYVVILFAGGGKHVHRTRTGATRATWRVEMATKAAGKQNVVTLKHLAAALAESHEVPKKKSVEILTDLV